MSTIILIILIAIVLIKLQDIHTNILYLKKRLDALEPNVNSKKHNDNKSVQILKEPIEEPTKEESSAVEIPLGIKERLTTKHQIPKKPIKEPSFIDDLKRRFDSSSLEDFFVGNLLLNVSIVTFVFGVGFFLKYSIDQNWIPIWGRVMIGILIGLGMLWGGYKTLHNPHKLISEGLFGGGIAILYLSIYAGYALEGFKFLSFSVALTAMITTTILAGVISVRFNSKATALFGLVGGFLTPFLINTAEKNIVALMIYILLLNIGVLYIAISKKWMVLNWLSFLITALIEMTVSHQSKGHFIFVLVSFVLLFVIYSIVPFIHEIRAKKITLEDSLLRLFGANIVIFLLVTISLLDQHSLHSKAVSILTTATALYLFAYAYYLKRIGDFTKNLYWIVIAAALGLLILTPVLLFDGNVLSAAWAIEALVLYWVSYKSEQPRMLWFSVAAFAFSFLRYMIGSVVQLSHIYVDGTYYSDLFAQWITAIVVIAAFLLPFKLPKQHLDGYDLRIYIPIAGVFLLFSFLNFQVYNWATHSIPQAKEISITLLWVIFGIALFVFSFFKDIDLGKQVSIGLIILAVLKAFFHDLAEADALYRIILFIVVGILLFVLAYFYKRKRE